MKKFTYPILVGALLSACGCTDDDSKSVAPSEEPVPCSSSVADESSSSVSEEPASCASVDSSSSEITASSSSVITESSPFVWEGEPGDVPRDFFNERMKSLSRDSTFLLPPEVAGIGYLSIKEQDFHQVETAFLDKISLEKAKAIFPNTLKAMQKSGLTLKDEYYMYFEAFGSSGYANMLTRVSPDTLFIVHTYQVKDAGPYQDEYPYGCSDVEEVFDFGMAYLIDSEEDLSNATLNGSWEFNHSWTCGCENTDESCKFLNTIYGL